MSVTDQASYVISARMAAKSLWTVECSCSVMTPCLRSIATSRRSKTLDIQQAALLRELSASTAKFEALFNQSGIFEGILDLRGYMREVNKLAVDWCGYTREQVLN